MQFTPTIQLDPNKTIISFNYTALGYDCYTAFCAETQIDDGKFDNELACDLHILMDYRKMGILNIGQ
jgi:hypothetical protein